MTLLQGLRGEANYQVVKTGHRTVHLHVGQDRACSWQSLLAPRTISKTVLGSVLLRRSLQGNLQFFLAGFQVESNRSRAMAVTTHRFTVAKF